MTVDTLGRAVDLYRQTATSRSAILLIVANLIPLVGVLFFGWSLLTILVLYWVENGIVGFWNVPKLLLAQGATLTVEAPEAGVSPGVRVFGQVVGGGAGRVGLSIFFTMHYGIFWLAHGFFVFAVPTLMSIGGGSILAGCGDVDPFGNVQPCSGPFGELVWSTIVIGGIALFISHGASFLLNYIGRGEYLTASPLRQMAAPYGRVVVLHLTILLGAFVVAFLDSPIGALLLLIGLKTVLDLGLHLAERRSAAARLSASPGAAAT